MAFFGNHPPHGRCTKNNRSTDTDTLGVVKDGAGIDLGFFHEDHYQPSRQKLSVVLSRRHTFCSRTKSMTHEMGESHLSHLSPPWQNLTPRSAATSGGVSVPKRNKARIDLLFLSKKNAQTRALNSTLVPLSCVRCSRAQPTWN